MTVVSWNNHKTLQIERRSSEPSLARCLIYPLMQIVPFVKIHPQEDWDEYTDVLVVTLFHNVMLRVWSWWNVLCWQADFTRCVLWVSLDMGVMRSCDEIMMIMIMMIRWHSVTDHSTTWILPHLEFSASSLQSNSSFTQLWLIRQVTMHTPT